MIPLPIIYLLDKTDAYDTQVGYIAQVFDFGYTLT